MASVIARAQATARSAAGDGGWGLLSIPYPPSPIPSVIEPAGDRIAAKAHHAAAEALDLRDQGVVDLVEQCGQLLGAAAWAVRQRQRLGQRREAGDIGQHRGAAGA